MLRFAKRVFGFFRCRPPRGWPAAGAVAVMVVASGAALAANGGAAAWHVTVRGENGKVVGFAEVDQAGVVPVGRVAFGHREAASVILVSELVVREAGLHTVAIGYHERVGHEDHCHAEVAIGFSEASDGGEMKAVIKKRRIDAGLEGSAELVPGRYPISVELWCHPHVPSAIALGIKGPGEAALRPLKRSDEKMIGFVPGEQVKK